MLISTPRGVLVPPLKIVVEGACSWTRRRRFERYYIDGSLMDQIQDHRRSAASPMIIKWGCSSLVALLIWVSMADLSTVNLNSKGNCWEDITGAKLVGVPIGAEELNYGGHNNRPSSIHFYTQVWCPSRKRRLEPSRDGGPPNHPDHGNKKEPKHSKWPIAKELLFGWKKFLNIETSN